METQLTTRREPERVRLIDANALLEAVSELKYEYSGCDDVRTWQSAILKAYLTVDSAPTVETTDDVLTRIGRHPTVFFGNDEWNAYVMQNLNQVYNWKTPLEAVTRLEASINNKHPTNEK